MTVGSFIPASYNTYDFKERDEEEFATKRPGLAFAIALLSIWLALGINMPAFAQTTGNLTDPYAITSLPAYYGFTKTVTITNQGQAPALNVVSHIVLLPPATPYAHVTLTGYSTMPDSTFRDQYGNLIGVYQWPDILPGHSVTLTFTYQDTSENIAYRLPSEYPPYNQASAIYREYTNPRLEAQAVNTDAPAIRALVNQLTHGLTNPYQRAQILFNWVAQNIQYNYSLKASGSALATLKSRLGICSDIADLYVSMLRTDGIPARFVGGYVTNNGDGQGGFHQWTEFYLPRVGWVVADPTWGRFGYFAALQDDWHIPLYDGIRSDISVHWQYAKSGTTRPYLTIGYHYHFSTEQSPPVTKSLALPVSGSFPTVSLHHTRLGFWAMLRIDARRWVAALDSYWIRLKLAIENL
ncbi:transglutaminase domain protein [Sulfobacillus acidophilus TPY]|uniref:Transglutaminase domain-containing protein n=1 Tax=Sulfobacillus acidophilus (strain ATCC 700253 / DSM 10332 / NAL) TaxID=679936 RepID=G8TTS0_SULAD|nr:transglutaminase domain protein [Sulfobacillus acidophilus TPY]AEW06829.1 transglutaminase domain-containing protein [Sulfobacillus acidophilus DSM 10332]